eukprot:CAMPEP_0184485414 /NCGR_PEP_ID=MMETSP0113_2-20130426/7028_1 /TAXON_ID=91329 /ORGANISM="Norrisiella sphaerica, Strain BC52" /LENGTH=630 /DNA_ID=CAMNT_0026866849 /DNA_START=111 /DNA_END=2001 /DNA_ORIENTATION=-
MEEEDKKGYIIGSDNKTGSNPDLKKKEAETGKRKKKRAKTMGYDENKDLKEWSKDEVTAWLQYIQADGDFDFKIESIACKGKYFAEMTEEQLNKRAPNCGDHIFNAKLSLLRKQGGIMQISRKMDLIECKEEIEPQVPSTGNFFTVSALKTAGLSPENSPENQKSLYCREDAFEHWKSLCQLAPGDAMNLYGPPGVGKSILTWAWAIWEWKTRKKSVLWIHVRRGLRCEVVFLRGTSMLNYKGTVGHDEALTIMKGEDAMNVDIAIVDGVRGDLEQHQLFTQYLHKIKENENRISVEVSSLSGKRDSVAEHMWKFKRQRIAAWKKEQILKACQNANFCKTIESKIGGNPNEDIVDRVLRKYYYAGHSARWMFARTIDEVVSEIESKMESVQNESDLFGLKGGERAREAVNHLFAVVEGHGGKKVRTFTSEHVVKQVAWKLGSEVVKYAYNVAATLRNPSFDGWVVEMDFLNQVKLAHEKQNEFKVTNKEGRDEKWAVKHVVRFMGDENLKDSLELKNLQEEFKNTRELKTNNHFWLVPTKWNQGAFDAIYICTMGKRLVVTFIQVTNSSKHSLKMHIMRRTSEALGDMFEIGGVRVVAIQPASARHREFKFEKPEGTLRNFAVGDTSSVW